MDGAGAWITDSAVATVVACCAVLAAIAAAPTATAQVQLGANLNRPANARFDCTTVPSSVPGLSYPTGVGTCTYVGISISGETTATPFPGAVITRVRIKTSAPTGPMRVTVARALGSTTAGVACCFYGGQSQVFTPQANATTAVNVRVPVRNDIDPSFGQTVDYLGISVLAPGVAIPANGPQEVGGSLAFFPHITPADTDNGRVDATSTSALPLLNADFTPLCGGLTRAQRETRRALERRAERAKPGTLRADVPAVASGAGGCLGGVTVRPGRLARSSAILPIDCNLSTACTGSIVLKGRACGGASAAAKKKTVGKKKLSIPAGGSQEVKVKLRKAAKGSKRLKVTAKATVAGGPPESAKLKLKKR